MDKEQETPETEIPEKETPEMETPETEIPETETPETETPDRTAELFAQLEENYNKKLEDQKRQYEKEIATHKAIIQQLLDGEQPTKATSADRLNARRNIKKW